MASNDLLRLLEKSKKRAKIFQKKIQRGNEADLQSLARKPRQSLLSNQNIMLMDSAEALVDAVTPYAIRNLTSGPIKVSTLSEDRDHGGDCEICMGGVKGLAVSFAETLNMSE